MSAAIWFVAAFVPPSVFLPYLDQANQPGLAEWCLVSMSIVMMAFAVFISARNFSSGWRNWVIVASLAVTFSHWLTQPHTAGDSWRFVLIVLPVGVGLTAGLLLGRIGYARTFLYIGLFAATVDAVAVVWQAATGTGWLVSGTLRRFGGFLGEPGALYPILVVVAVFAISQYLRSRRLKRWAWTFLIVLLLGAVCLTGYRTGVLGLLAGSAFVMASCCASWPERAPVVALVIASTAVVLFAREAPGVNHLVSAQSVNGRMLALSEAWRTMDKWWLTGVGPGMFQGQAVASRFGRETIVAFAGAGTGLAQIMVEWGLGATAAIVLVAVELRDKWRSTWNHESKTLVAVLVPIAVMNMTDVVFLSPAKFSVTLLFAVCLGLSLASPTATNGSNMASGSANH